MIKAILFDLDGTLVNTIHANYYTYKTIAQNRGLSFPSIQEFISFKGNFKDFEESIGLQGNTEKEWVDLYIQFSDLDQPFEDSLEVLQKIKTDGFKLGLATTASWRRINLITEKFGLKGFFDHIVSTMETSKHKPDPHSLIVLSEKFGMKCEECVYIGDSIVDVLAAKSAGMVSVGLLRGKKEDYFKDVEPDAIFESLNDAYEFIKRMS